MNRTLGTRLLKLEGFRIQRQSRLWLVEQHAGETEAQALALALAEGTPAAEDVMVIVQRYEPRDAEEHGARTEGAQYL